MAINEVTVIGRVFRKLIDKENMRWLKISYWTHSSDVEFRDGRTAEEKLGQINGISSDTNMSRADIAASTKSIYEIKQSFQDGVNSIYDLLIKLGFTPDSKSLEDILNCINKMHTDRFEEGKSSAEGILRLTLGAITYGGNPSYGGNIGNHGNRYNLLPVSIEIRDGKATVISGTPSINGPRYISEGINDPFFGSANISNVSYTPSN
ncbi:MAG: hypothetical protein NC489_18530 [Ruminococcus flavefaciens]|nr:hypothetical protein [Ruminococcus flavefaciens]